jgi:hypothetical protein
MAESFSKRVLSRLLAVIRQAELSVDRVLGKKWKALR